MATFDESILNETKKSLGVAEDVTAFDPEIRMHLNSALARLNQLGIGPEGGFEVETADQQWDDFLSSNLKLSSVKTYVYLSVRLKFDPPSNSWTATQFKEELEKLEWTINETREDDIPIPTTPDDEEEEELVLDGGVI